MGDPDASVPPLVNEEFFIESMLKWFEFNGRKYPWRNETDPFKILIAEIMLQRTRADQVLPVYLAFVRKYPTIQSLAQANHEEIANLISSLGLPSRGETFLRIARTIIQDHGSRIPSERQQLLRLNGIGDYIANAFLLFGLRDGDLAIDSNVVRVVSRFFSGDGESELRRNKKFLQFCKTLVNRLDMEDRRNLNYSIIDFSAAICKKTPLCCRCPLASRCRYNASMGPSKYP